MSEPTVRTNIGKAIQGKREKWYIQGHIGSTWQDGQYVRTRDLPKVKEAFEDLLTRLGTDYIDLGMIHYVDSEKEFAEICAGPFLSYVHELKEKGVIRHVGLSTHNPKVAKLAAESGEVEMMLFSVNPAFDLMPPTDNIEDYFAEEYDASLGGIDRERAEQALSGQSELLAKSGALAEEISAKKSGLLDRVCASLEQAGAVHPLCSDPAGGGQHYGGL